MNRFNSVKRVIVCITVTASIFVAAIPCGFAEETVRPEIGRPLEAVSALLKANKFNEALTKIREVDGVPNKTAHETYLIESMRGSAASGAGENATIIKSFEVVVASGKAPPATQLKLFEALAGAYYRGGDYAAAAKWSLRYLREGGSNQKIRVLLLQSYFQAGDYANSVRELLIDIHADEQADRTPPEEKIQLLANNYKRLNNESEYLAAIEKWRKYYPKASRPADGYFSRP